MKTVQRLDGVRLGLAGGIVWGLSIFFLTIISINTGYGAGFLSILDFYPGYDISLAGSAVGFVWGMVDGFIGLGLIAWLYNHLHRYGK